MRFPGWVRAVRRGAFEPGTRSLDHLIVRGEQDLRLHLREYFAYYNQLRPHQGIAQQIPAEVHAPVQRPTQGAIVSRPVFNGLVHTYHRVAA